MNNSFNILNEDEFFISDKNENFLKKDFIIIPICENINNIKVEKHQRNKTKKQ